MDWRFGVAMPKNGQDLGALDALIVLAFLEGMARRSPSFTDPEPRLDPADQEAMDALGSDLVRVILEETI